MWSAATSAFQAGHTSPRSSYLARWWTGAYGHQEGLVSSFTNYCWTCYLAAIIAFAQKGMRNENTVKGLEASVEYASCHVEEVLEDLAPTPASRRSRRLPLSMMVLLMNVGVMNSRRTCFKKRSRWWSWRLVFLCFITPVNFVFHKIIPSVNLTQRSC